jgi:crotonobetainyl-CoA:carnitine CoA-transferase CaiB-like acyl-CoA transferase
MSSGGAYEGVRVAELTTGLAAPYAGMFLADNGADVVKVEAPSGDPYRADPGFQTVNRNKRSVVVSDDDRATLLAAADVIFVDRPGQAGALRALNTSAVIITMPPWGERGPKVDDATSSTILHAATGIAWNQQSYAEVPIDVVVPVAEYGTGVLGALAAAAGLLARARTGAAVIYEVSEVAGAAAVQLGDARPAGEPAVRPGDSALGSKGRVACYRLVEAGDGRWFFLACGTARFYKRMLEVIGRPDLLDDPALANPPWGLMFDPAIERLTPILDEVFATRRRDEWLAMLSEADVPAQPVLTRDEFLQTSVAAANRMDVTIEHPELGEVSMMGMPFEVATAPGSIRRPAPLLGEHSAEVVGEWRAAGPGAFASDPQPGSGERPLAGVRVIDLASFIAGPVVSRHLAMLGAEVIKVEPPTGDPFRAIGAPFESWNQGKQSVILDLTTEDGQEQLRRLAATVDVVIENFRPGVAKRLGVDRDTLRTVNPNLVFLSSPGYGLDESMANRPAFDPLVQALGGLMAAQGGESEPVFLSVPIHDVVTPMLGALGLVTGLWLRDHTGAGQDVRTSLAQSTMAVQAAEFTRFAGRPTPRSGGFDHSGTDGSSWRESEDGPVWFDGDLEVAVCRTGLTGSPLAEANDLLTTTDHADLGPIVVFGQLIGGAGPAPHPAPALDADGDRIRAELADSTASTSTMHNRHNTKPETP